MGFLRTKVRKYDSTIIDIPNSQLGGQRLINISRCNTCRVITTLRFEYKDIQQIPKTLQLVKEEIAKACPTLIKEGKPFRGMISSFERDYVEATINCSFELPPTGEAFWANREQMVSTYNFWVLLCSLSPLINFHCTIPQFLAIDRGVNKSGISYATPHTYRLDAS